MKNYNKKENKYISDVKKKHYYSSRAADIQEIWLDNLDFN